MKTFPSECIAFLVGRHAYEGRPGVGKYIVIVDDMGFPITILCEGEKIEPLTQAARDLVDAVFG